MRSNYLKLGLMVSFFILSSLFFLTWISGNPFEKKRHYFFLFPDVQGISLGSKVRYSGLPCGKVIGFTFPENQQKGILVKAEITNPSVKIYQDDLVYSIPNSTIAAEYEISIKPNRSVLKKKQELLANGGTLVGLSPLGLNRVSEKADNLLERVVTTVSELQTSSEKINQYLKSLEPIFRELETLGKSGKITQVSQDLSELSANLTDFWQENKTNLSSILRQVNSASKKIDRKLDLLDLLKEPEVRSLVENVNQTSFKIRELANSLEKKDVRKLSEVVSQTNRVLAKVQSEDPNRDLPTLLLNSSKNILDLTEELNRLTKQFKGKTLLGSLLTKVK